jgi:sulfatase maturation enzyme AslB (radical SAM superfamily)
MSCQNYLDKIDIINLQVTAACPLNCSFCFQEHKDEHNNKVFKDYAQLLKFLNQFGYEKDKLEVLLMGGEISLIGKEIYNSVKQINKLLRTKQTRINHSLITNGIDVDFILDILDNQLYNARDINISWDGIEGYKVSRISDPPINTNENLIKLGTTEYAKDIIIRVVVSPPTINYLADSMKFLVDNNFRRFYYYYLYDCDTYAESSFIQTFINQVTQILDFYLTCDTTVRFDNLERMIWFKRNETDNLCKIAKYRKTLCRYLGRFLHISVDGDINACPIFEGSSDPYFKQYKLGDIYTGLDETKVRQLFDSFSDDPFSHSERCFNCKNYQCFICKAMQVWFVKHKPEGLYQKCELLTQEHDLYYNFIDQYQDHPNLQYVQQLIDQNEFYNFEYVDTPPWDYLNAEITE